jgi:hypothetical protein
MVELTLGEGDQSSLAGGVVGEDTDANEAAHARDLDDMTLVVLDHIWRKCSTGVPASSAKTISRGRVWDVDIPMTDQIDLDQLLESLRWNLEDRVVMSDTGIVDENAR